MRTVFFLRVSPCVRTRVASPGSSESEGASVMTAQTKSGLFSRLHVHGKPASVYPDLSRFKPGHEIVVVLQLACSFSIRAAISSH